MLRGAIYWGAAYLTLVPRMAMVLQVDLEAPLLESLQWVKNGVRRKLDV